MKKVELFETYASDCKCGGNCTCGTSKVNEAKKLKYKDIHNAWNLAYGEDFEYEYEGVYQEIVGKYRGKISKADLAKLWDKMYGENLAADYSGFFDQLDESVIIEANADGTISDDEDERRDELEYEIYHKAEELIQYLKDEAENIGGPFRSPGIISDCVKQIKDAFRKNKIRL